MATTLSTKAFLLEPRGSFASATGAHFLLAMGPAAPTPPPWNSSFLSGSSPSGQLVSPALSLPRSEFPVGSIPDSWSLGVPTLLGTQQTHFSEDGGPELSPSASSGLQAPSEQELASAPLQPPPQPQHPQDLGSHLKPDLWAADGNLANIFANLRKVLHGCCALICLGLRTSILH